MQSIKRYFDQKSCGIALPADRVRQIIDRHEVGDWFFHAFAGRASRWHVCGPSLWVQRHLPKKSAIFETGCGCGLNLIWFAQKGFTNLKGSDISSEAVRAGQELAGLAGAPVELWQDDGLAPSRLPGEVDLLLALNWTYHVDDFDLGAFLSRYASLLGDGGHLIIDVVDSSFDRAENNQYLTSDWGKTLEERGASEYKRRYSGDDVVGLANGAGYEVRHVMSGEGQVIPRVVYILRKK